MDRSDIEDVFNELLDENDQTTSLEVKEELRSRGFWATQAIVGVALREIADENGIDWDFNGTYRTYYKAGTQNMSPTPSFGGVLVSAPTVPAKKRVPITAQDREPIDTPDTGDWEVTSTADPSTVMYFKGALTPGQARYAFHLETGVAYVDIRSKRV
jgi:hypothetical protein